MKRIGMVFELALIGTFTAGAAVNLIEDADVDSVPLSSAFRYVGSATVGRLTPFEEDATWNRCAKLEITGFAKDAKGRPTLTLNAELGGEAKSRGVAVTPGTTYKFAFELRGTAPRAVSLIRFWNRDNKATTVFSPVKDIVPQAEWTQYRGSFKAPEDAVRAALVVEFWWSEDYGKMPYKVGDYVLIDKVSIAAESRGRDVWPIRACVAGEGKPGVLDAFQRMGNQPAAASVGTTGEVLAKADGLYLSFKMEGTARKAPYAGKGGGDVWMDDHIEILLASPEPGSKAYHYAVSSGGGRWMPEGGDYGDWTAKVRETGTGWTADVFLPWKLLGCTARPASGTRFLFNIARERILGDERDPKTPRGNRRGYWQWFDDSSWTFVRDGFGDRAQWGFLFIDTAETFLEKGKSALSEPSVAAKAANVPSGDLTADVRLLAALREENRLVKLAKEPVVVAQVPTTVDPSVPFLPDELMDPQPLLKVRAAVNERTALAVAVANTTEAFEEYRVSLESGWSRQMPADEQKRPENTLRTADGAVLDRSHYSLSRGVRYRDADSDGHGARLDVLAPMDGASALSVPPKEAGLVWVSLDCHGLKPGTYRGTLVVTPLMRGQFVRRTEQNGIVTVEDGSKSVPVEVEVLPFALPENLRLGLNGYTRPLRDYEVDFGNRYDSMMLQVTPWFFDMTFNADGSVKTKSLRAQLKPQMALIRERARRVGKLPRASVAYGAFSVFRDVKAKASGLKPGTEAFWTAYRNWIVFIDETMKAEGLPDYDIEVFDEPQPALGKETFARALSEAKAVVPGIRTYVTSGVRHYFDVGQDLVDTWVFYHGNAQELPKAAAFAQRPGKRTTVYACGTSMRQELYRYYRVLPWMTLMTGSDFVSIYQLTEQAPLLAFRKTPFGGLTYDTGTALLPSIRLEALYRGMQDVNYLRYLKALAVGESAEARAARAFVDAAVREVVVAAPQDATRADTMREKAIAHIMKLLKK